LRSYGQNGFYTPKLVHLSFGYRVFFVRQLLLKYLKMRGNCYQFSARIRKTIAGQGTLGMA